MKNEITHEEKLDFYKKFTENKLQSKLDSISTQTARIGIHSTAISLMISCACGIINPWLFFLLIPSSFLPIIFLKVSSFLQNKEIQKLNKNFTIKTLEDMKKTTEWYLLGREANAQQLKFQNSNENSQKKYNKRNVKNVSNNQNIKKKHKINNNIFITYSLLRDFATSINCSLIEFSPLPNYKQNDSYYVVLGRNNYHYEFEVSNRSFQGIYEADGVDFTETWLDFLETQNNINSIN